MSFPHWLEANLKEWGNFGLPLKEPVNQSRIESDWNCGLISATVEAVDGVEELIFSVHNEHHLVLIAKISFAPQQSGDEHIFSKPDPNVCSQETFHELEATVGIITCDVRAVHAAEIHFGNMEEEVGICWVVCASDDSRKLNSLSCSQTENNLFCQKCLLESLHNTYSQWHAFILIQCE